MSNDPPRTNRSAMPAESGATVSPEERGAALAFLQRLAAEVSAGTVDLPCFPDVVIRISQALEDPNTTAEQAVRIVGLEPRLAARVLQTANSAAFNISGKPLLDLRSAVTRLGFQIVQSTAMSYALQQMQNEDSLRLIAQPMRELWSESIAVATISKIVAGRTKINSDEAFLTGLLHGIGRLYIIARAVGKPDDLGRQQSLMELLADWQASIGKAVLENWGFADDVCEAVGDQRDYERKWLREPRLTDVLIVSLVLADALKTPAPREVAIGGISAFASIGLTEADCAAILTSAESKIALMSDALR